jgi:hypothetical protein
MRLPRTFLAERQRTTSRLEGEAVDLGFSQCMAPDRP